MGIRAPGRSAASADRRRSAARQNLPRAVAAVAIAAGTLAWMAFPLYAYRAEPGPGRALPPVDAAAPIAAEAFPSFSRKYRTSCATCHIAPGKLNAEGEAFRLNGYRFAVDDEELREDDPLPLGAEPWKDLWPDAIWPGELPGSLPLSIHLANDVRIAAQGDGRTRASYRFPQAIHLFTAATLGGGMATSLGVAWRPGVGVHINEAKVKIQDVLPFLPPRALNVWVGAQNPHLLTFGNPSLDQAARLPFLWQRLSLGDWELENPATGEVLVSGSRFRLTGARPAIELNGVAAGRLFYGVGLAQSPPAGAAADAQATDVFVKLRYKLGGIGLDGRAPSGFEPFAWGGQLLDTGLILEHFAYFGEWHLDDPVGTDRHRSLGFSARAVHGRWDLGIGHVRGRNSRPWGIPGQTARHSSVFGRAEYLAFPWVFGSLKLERTALHATSPDPAHPGFEPFRRARLLPGGVFLVHQNVRIIAEGELFIRDQPPSAPVGGSAHALWLRLDVAF
jgi:hypothetical protein